LICTRIWGNVFEEGLAADNEELRGFETVAVEWDECAKRILRKTTRSGREIGIQLAHQTLLRHGDILAREGDAPAIVVYLEPCEVLVVRPESVRQFGVVAYELGNRHLPLEITDKGEIVLLPDDPTKLLLAKLNAPFALETRRFQPIPKGGGHHHHHHLHHPHHGEEAVRLR